MKACVCLILLSAAVFQNTVSATSCVRIAQLVADFPPSFVGTATVSAVSDPAASPVTYDNLPYPTVTDYAAVAAGTYELDIAVNGFPTITLSSRFSDHQSYTALSSGLLAADPLTQEFSDDTLIIDDNTLAQPGQSRVRFIHVAPAERLVDVVANQQVLYAAVGYKNISDYLTLDANNYSIEIRQNQTGTPLMDTQNIALVEGTVNTLWLIENRFDGPALDVLHTVDAPNVCSQQNYTGIWFDPNRSGQGVQFLDSGQFAGVWYAYGLNQETTWLNFAGPIQDHQFTGSLVRFTGPSFSENFDPSQVQGTEVGTVTINFSQSNRSAVFQGSVDGATVILNLVPFDIP